MRSSVCMPLASPASALTAALRSGCVMAWNARSSWAVQSRFLASRKRSANPMAHSRPIMSSQRQEDIIQRVAPGGDPEAAREIQRAEEQSRNRTKGERPDLEWIAIGSDVVEGGKDQGTKDRRHDSGGHRLHSENLGTQRRESRHQQDAKDQLFI